jgi:hypothetical protein
VTEAEVFFLKSIKSPTSLKMLGFKSQPLTLHPNNEMQTNISAWDKRIHRWLEILQ